MTPDYLVLQTKVKKVHSLFIGSTFISEQVLDCIDIIGVPFKFEPCRGALA